MEVIIFLQIFKMHAFPQCLVLTRVFITFPLINVLYSIQVSFLGGPTLSEQLKVDYFHAIPPLSSHLWQSLPILLALMLFFAVQKSLEQFSDWLLPTDLQKNVILEPRLSGQRVQGPHGADLPDLWRQTHSGVGGLFCGTLSISLWCVIEGINF